MFIIYIQIDRLAYQECSVEVGATSRGYKIFSWGRWRGSTVDGAGPFIDTDLAYAVI
jgi:hypothetical protein